MPYLKGKDIRDIYLIKIARLGFSKEGTPEENQDDLRLVFEIEFIGQLFGVYKSVDLKIWRTFIDTTLNEFQKTHSQEVWFCHTETRPLQIHTIQEVLNRKGTKTATQDMFSIRPG